MLAIILLGPPGAGKGTQAAVLAARHRLAHVCSGELLRQHVAAGGEHAGPVAGWMARGELVPDEILADVVLARVGEVVRSPAGAGVVMDGFPKTLAQARALDTALAVRARRLTLAFELTADRSCLEERLRRRAGVERRRDDDPDVVRRRLDSFGDVPDDLRAHYRDRGAHWTVDATMPLERVSDHLGALVDRALAADRASGPAGMDA